MSVNWQPKKIVPSDINDGKRYDEGMISVEDYNDVIEGVLKGNEDAESALNKVEAITAEEVEDGGALAFDCVTLPNGNLKFVLKNTKGDKGDKGDIGSTGLTPSISVIVTALPEGATPTVTKSGTNEEPILTFGIPKGDTGATGETGAQGLQGEKGDTGEVGPQGQKGDQGNMGPQGETGATGETGLTPMITVVVTMLEESAEPTVTKTGTDEAPIYTLGIPKGNTGATGPTGETGAKGDTGDSGVIIQSTEPEGRINAMWIDSATGVIKYWNGTSWANVYGVFS